MVSAKGLISNLFHGTVSNEDMIRNFKELCLLHLSYRYVNDFQEIKPVFSFEHSMAFDDLYYEGSSYYIHAKDYAHFAKPLFLGFGKIEGLIIESSLSGYLGASNKETLKKLRFNEMKIHGYGSLWNMSKTKSQLKKSIYRKLKIPRLFTLKELSEDYMKKAVENI